MKKNRITLFKSYLNEYLYNSTIDGTRSIASKQQNNNSYAKQIFWAIIVSLMFIIAIILLTYSYLNYMDAPTVTSEFTKRVNVLDVPFPAIMICSNNRISKKSLMNLAEKLLSLNETRIGFTVPEVFNSLLVIGQMYASEYGINDNSNVLNNNIEIIHDILIKYYGDPYPLDDILLQLSPRCNETLKRCVWNGEIINCTKIFTERKSYLGMCCAFNYLRPNASELRQYLNTNIDVPKIKNKFVIGYGSTYGLKILMDPLIDDYAFSIRSHIGSSILVYEPEMFPDHVSGAVLERIILPTEEKFLSIEPVLAEGDPLLRQYLPAARHCVFRNEMHSIFKNLYSLAECLLFCRLNSLMETCGCQPPQFTNVGNNKICLLNDLDCMLHWKRYWLSMDSSTSSSSSSSSTSTYGGGTQKCPHCLSRCTINKYKIRYSGSYFSTREISRLTEGIHAINDSIIHLYFSKKKYIKYGQSPIYTWYDLLSVFGGICSLVLGASIISVTEIIYFLTGRFFSCCTTIFKTNKTQQRNIVNEIHRKNYANNKRVNKIEDNFIWMN